MSILPRPRNTDGTETSICDVCDVATIDGTKDDDTDKAFLAVALVIGRTRQHRNRKATT